MATHIVEQGECLSSLAGRVGLQAQDLHNHPDNADLKRLRPYPNILAPGDIVEIPAPDQKSESAVTDKANRFVVHSPKVKLRIVMLDYRGNPYQDKRFVITVGKRELKGKTTREGLIECDVPANAQRGHLRVWLDDSDPDPHIDRDLLIGHLDPIDMVTGVQARLDNLGYPCNVTGEVDDFTAAAVRRFRAHFGLDSDSENSGETSPTADVSAGPNTNSSPAQPSGPIDSAVLTELQSQYEDRH